MGRFRKSSYRNIEVLKTAIVEKWNKMAEEFILKAGNWFRRHVASIMEKIAAILIKYTVLCRSCYFLINIFQ